MSKVHFVELSIRKGVLRFECSTMFAIFLLIAKVSMLVWLMTGGI